MILKDSHFDHLEPSTKISKIDTIIETLGILTLVLKPMQTK